MYFYARHHNPLLITNRSCTLTIHKDRIFWKKLFDKNEEMDFKNGVKNIKAAGYNDAPTVVSVLDTKTWFWSQSKSIEWIALTTTKEEKK
jgi:hypothetical protein